MRDIILQPTTLETIELVMPVGSLVEVYHPEMAWRARYSLPHPRDPGLKPSRRTTVMEVTAYLHGTQMALFSPKGYVRQYSMPGSGASARHTRHAWDLDRHAGLLTMYQALDEVELQLFKALALGVSEVCWTSFQNLLVRDRQVFLPKTRIRPCIDLPNGTSLLHGRSVAHVQDYSQPSSAAAAAARGLGLSGQHAARRPRVRRG